MAEGVDYCGPVKTLHKGCKLVEYLPVGFNLVMKINPIVPGGRPLMKIGYK